MEYKEGMYGGIKHSGIDRKAMLINKTAPVWLRAPCVRQDDIEKCENRKKVAHDYGSEYMKIIEKMNMCKEINDEFNNQTSSEYMNCIGNVELLFRATIENYYEKFMSLS